MSTENIEIGSIVLDKFEVLGLIAEGGMGRVYKVRDVRLQSIIALKLLKDSDPKSLMRFQAEAKAASKLNHRNIAPVFDFGINETTAYLSMEFVEGETLHEILRKRRTLPMNMFQDVFVQVCSGVLHAHENGIVHRDLKPSNIMVNELESGLVTKILDFGIAKRIDIKDGDGKLTASGSIVGSPLYMSPEQTRAGAITPQSDVYSMGCMMWHAMTGVPPFQGDTALDTMILHQSASREADELPKIYPVEFRDLVVSMLAKDPESRPSISDQILPALAILEGVEEVREQAPELVDSKPRYKRLVVGAFVALIGIVIVASVSYLVLKKNSERDLTPISSSGLFTSGASMDEADNTLRVMPSGDMIFMGGIVATDEVLEALKHKDRIVIVKAGDSEVTDDAFGALKKFPRLSELHISRTRVKTLDGLSKVRTLKILDIGHNEVTTGSLKNLVGLDLRILVLSGTQVGDGALEYIESQTGLEKLNLENCKFSTFKKIGNLRHLRELNLSETNITVPELISIVSSLPQLEKLDVRGCSNVSGTQSKILEKKFPAVAIAPDRSQIKTLETEGLELEKKKDLAGALKCFSTGLAQANAQGVRHELVAHLLCHIARVKFGEGDFATADRFATKALEEARALGVERPEIGAMDVLSLVRYRQRRPKELEALRSGARAKAIRVFADRPGEMNQRCTSLGDLFGTMSDYPTAVKYFEDVVLFRRKLYGANSPEVAGACVKLGHYLLHSDEVERAEECFKNALRILQANKPGGNSETRIKPNAYAGLTAIAILRQDYVEAKKYNDIAVTFPHETRDITIKILQQRLKILEATKANPGELQGVSAEIHRVRAAQSKKH